MSSSAASRSLAHAEERLQALGIHQVREAVGDSPGSHRFGRRTHAMHFIPVFGFIASRKLQASLARRAVFGFAGLFVALVGYTFMEALSGRAFLAMLY